MPAAFSLWCKEFLTYSFVYTAGEKGSLALSVLPATCNDLARSLQWRWQRWIPQYAELEAVLSMLPAGLGHCCSPGRSEISCLPPAVTPCLVFPVPAHPEEGGCLPSEPFVSNTVPKGHTARLAVACLGSEGAPCIPRPHTGFLDWEAFNNWGDTQTQVWILSTT